MMIAANTDVCWSLPYLIVLIFEKLLFLRKIQISVKWKLLSAFLLAALDATEINLIV